MSVGALKYGRYNVPTLIRFMNFVFHEPMSGCWLWGGHLKPDGYGTFKLEGRHIGAHRFSFGYFNSPIPNGLSIDHKCNNRSCVNPEHLQAVTHQENMLLGMDRRNGSRDICRYGHNLTKENTYIYGDGGRACRACAITRALRSNAKTRAASKARVAS